MRPLRAGEYFAGILGAHPTFRGGSVADLLATYEGTVPLNVAYLAPHGTIRHAVLGASDAPANDDARARIVALLADLALATGARTHASHLHGPADEILGAPAHMFHQGVRRGPFVQVSGQGPVDPETSEHLFPGNVTAQTTRTLRDVLAIVAD